MKILFTGSSSFTGMWFIQELIHSGHEVTATFSSPKHSYEGLRRERVERVCDSTSRIMFDCPFGTNAFLHVLQTDSWDLLCHHSAEVANYRNPNFDVLTAVANNTRQLRKVLQNDVKKVMLTDSVFSPGEGCGSNDLPAISPYGLSKGLTTQMFRFHCYEANVPLQQFVIPNPFGPYEESRFVAYVMQQWLQEKTAEVKQPLYIRDNIPVSLLAKAYVQACESDNETFHPSGYIGSQAEFTERLAQAMRARLDLPCEYTCALQTEFLEPAVRVNTDMPIDIEWNETQAWDEFAIYYQQRYAVEALV